MQTLRTVRALLAVAALVGASAVAIPAFAGEPTAADVESALQLYKDGKKLRESGDLPKALEKLRAAHALVETPITALELGRTYAMMGKLVEAREILLSVPRIPVRKNESQKAVEARKDSETVAAELKPRLASLTVKFRADAGASKMTVDGVAVPLEAAHAPRIMNPGRHVVVVEAGGKPVETEVTLSEGQTRELELDLPVASGDSPPPPPPPPPPGGETTGGGHGALVYGGFGLAIVGVGVGAVTGFMTLSTAGSLKDACRDERCPPASQSDLDSASTTGTISTVAFALGAVGLAVGVAGLVLDKGKTPAASARIVVSPTGAGLRGTF